MRNIKAVFIKQLIDTYKNLIILVQFIIFPAMAFIMTEFVAKANSDISDNMFVAMFASMFVGMSLLIATTAAIAEDRERKSLRLLVIAGVKPHEYLLGVVGTNFLAGVVISVVFGLLAGYGGVDFLKFVFVLILGSVTSILIGATIGILAKNQQAATAAGVPVAMIFAFFPMIADFNESFEKVADVLFSRQISVVANDPSVGILKPVLIISANAAVFLMLFILAYRKKGLKE